MIKRLLPIISLFFILTSCNLLNTHNIKNDYRWKNKKFAESTDVQLLFDPVIYKAYDSTSTLHYFLEEPNKLMDTEKTLKEKLSKRNFTVVPDYQPVILRIDTLAFIDKAEMMSVLSNDGSEILGNYEKNDITIKVIGTLTIHDSTRTTLESQYHYTDEPREGYIIKGTIAYSNAAINLDKVMNNILNEFSYKCYQVMNEYH